jgi:hypothetical protein
MAVELLLCLGAEYYKRIKIRIMTNEEKAKMIAEQCKPCSRDFYTGIYQGVKLTLNAEQKHRSEIEIPDFMSVSEKVEEGEDITPLEKFIYDYDIANENESFAFRNLLLEVLKST